MHRTPTPLSVTIAATLIAVYGVLSLLRLALYGSGLPSSAVGMAIWAFCIVGFSVVAYSLYRGSNVMRCLLALAVGASLVLFPIYKPEMPEGGLHLVLYVLQLALPVLLLPQQAVKVLGEKMELLDTLLRHPPGEVAVFTYIMHDLSDALQGGDDPPV